MLTPDYEKSIEDETAAFMDADDPDATAAFEIKKEKEPPKPAVGPRYKPQKSEEPPLKYLGHRTVIIIVAIFMVVILAIVGAIIFYNTPARRIKRLLSLGQKYLSELQYEDALLAYSKALDLDIICEDAYIGMSEVYMAMGKYPYAINSLRRGLHLTNGSEPLKEQYVKVQDRDRKEGKRIKRIVYRDETGKEFGEKKYYYDSEGFLLKTEDQYFRQWIYPYEDTYIDGKLYPKDGYTYSTSYDGTTNYLKHDEYGNAIDEEVLSHVRDENGVNTGEGHVTIYNFTPEYTDELFIGENTIISKEDDGTQETVILKYQYFFDEKGQLLKRADGNGKYDMFYDNNGQLEKAIYKDRTETYEKDEDGYITRKITDEDKPDLAEFGIEIQNIQEYEYQTPGE